MSNASIAQALGQSLAPEHAAFVEALRATSGAHGAAEAAALLRAAAEGAGSDAPLYHLTAADLLSALPAHRRERLDHLRAAYATATGWQRELEAAWSAAGVADARAVVALEQSVHLDPTDISRAEMAVAEADRAGCLPLLAEAWEQLIMLRRSEALRCALELELRLDAPDASEIEATYESALRLSMQQERLVAWLTRRWERDLSAPSVASIEAGVELIGLHAAAGEIDRAAAIARLLWHQTGISSNATREALDALERSAPKSLPTLLLLRQRAELLERWDEAMDRLEEEAEATEQPVAAAQLLLHAASIAVERAQSPGRSLDLIRRATLLDPGVRARAAALLDTAIERSTGTLRDELLADRRSLAGSLGDWATLYRLSVERLPAVTAPEARASLLLELGEMEQRGLSTPQSAMERLVEAAQLAEKEATRHLAIEQLYRLLEQPTVQLTVAERLVGLLQGDEQRPARLAMHRFLADRIAAPEGRVEQLLAIARTLEAMGDEGAEAAWQRCFEAAPALDEAWERSRELALQRGDGQRAFALIDAQISCATRPEMAAALARTRLQNAARWTGDHRAAWGATAALFLLDAEAPEVPTSLASLAQTPEAVEMLALLEQHLTANAEAHLVERWLRLSIAALGWRHPYALSLAVGLLDRSLNDADFAAEVEAAVEAAGSAEQKLHLLRRTASRYPDDAAATLALARHLAGAGASDEAQALLQAAAERLPEEAALWREIIAIAHATGSTVAEVVALEALAELSGLSAAERFEALLALARHYDRTLGRPDLAVARASAACRIRPTDADAISLLRDHAASFGDFGPLEAALATAIELDDGDPEGRLSLERLQLALRRGASDAPAMATALVARAGLAPEVLALARSIAATLAASDETLSFDAVWSQLEASADELPAADWQRIGARLHEATDPTTAGAFASRWIARGDALSDDEQDAALAAIVAGGGVTLQTWVEVVERRSASGLGPKVAAQLAAIPASPELGASLLSAFEETAISIETEADTAQLVELFGWMMQSGASAASLVSQATRLLEPAGPQAVRLAAGLFDLLAELDRTSLGLPLLEAALGFDAEQPALAWSRIEALARQSDDSALLVRAMRGLRAASTKRSERTRISRELATLLADRLADPAAAADALAEALEEEPLHLTLLEDHAAMLERAERWTDALRAIERFASAAPVQELQDDLTFRAAVILGERLQRPEAAMALLLPMAQSRPMAPERRTKAVEIATAASRWEALSTLLDSAATLAPTAEERQSLQCERATRLAAGGQHEAAWKAAQDAAATGLNETIVALLLEHCGNSADSAAAAQALIAIATAADASDLAWPLWERAAALLAGTEAAAAFDCLQPAAALPALSAKAIAAQKQLATNHQLWPQLAALLAAASDGSVAALTERATVEFEQLRDPVRALTTACAILAQEPLHEAAWAIINEAAKSAADWTSVDAALASAPAPEGHEADLLERRLTLARGPLANPSAAFERGRALHELAPERCAWSQLEADARAAGRLADWLPRAAEALIAAATGHAELTACANEAERCSLADLALQLHRAAADRSFDAAESWLALARATEATDGPAAAAALLAAPAAQAEDPDARALLTLRAEQLQEAALPPEAKAARAALDAALSSISKAASEAGTASDRAALAAARASWLIAHGDLERAAAALAEAAELDPSSRVAFQVAGDLALAQGDPAKGVTAYLTARVNQEPAADHPHLCTAPLPGEAGAESNATIRYTLRAARALESVGAEEEAFETLMNGHLEEETSEAPLLGLARISLLRGNSDAATSYLSAIRRVSDAAGEIPSAAYLALAAKLESEPG